MGKDFNNADKGKTFKRGGDMATNMDPKMMATRAAKRRGASMAPTGMAGMGGLGMKKGGMAAFEKSGKDVEKKGMKEGSKADMALDKKQMMGMKKGGMAAFEKSGKDVEMKGIKEGSKKDMAMDKKQMAGMKKGGNVTTIKMGAVKTASPSRDGLAAKGKTQGKVVSMSGNRGLKRGGKC